jgi:hypothetical protein
MGTKKLTAIWTVLRSSQVHLVYQRHPGAQAYSLGVGHGDIRDLVLLSKQLKISYDGFLNMINEAAANAGELHALAEIREAVDVIEGEGDGRN